MAQASGALTPAAHPAAANRVSLPFLRVQERKLLLATIDAFLTLFIMATAYDVWKARVHPVDHNMTAVPWAWIAGGSAVWLIVSWLVGGYQLDVADRLPRALRNTLTVGIVSAMVGFAAYWVFLKTYPRPALALALVAAPCAVGLWRAAYALGLRRPIDATRIVVLGSDTFLLNLQEAGREQRDYYRFVGYVPIGDGAKAEEDARTLDTLIDIQGAHRVVVAPRTSLSDALMASLTRAIERGVEVVDFNTAYEEMAEKVAVEHAGDQWLASLPTRPGTSAIQDAVIRGLDIVGSVIGLALTAILFLPIAAAVKMSSRGPLLYAQQRLGRGGKPFTIYKFRSMRMDAESDGAQWASQRDSRATSAGRYLRCSHLDELPQFWNVLRGEMSLVGPRPERPEFTDALSRTIPFYRLRLSVRPGLTGLKQIKVGYASNVDEHLEVLRHDLYYVKHRALALNLLIIARTVGSVIGRTGR